MLIKLVTQLNKILYNVHEQYNSFLGNVVLVDDIIPKKGVLLFLCSKEAKTQVNKGFLAAIAAKS